MLRRLVFPLLLGLAGAGVLVALGLWQVQRLAWKEAILADITARIEAEPVALPAVPDPAADRYLPVAVAGRFAGRDIRVLVSRKGDGAGYRVVAAYETEDGRRILIDRGFLPEAAKTAPPASGAAKVAGNLHWPDEVDGYTPPPDARSGIWFARDLPAMAAALGTEPVLVVAKAVEPADPALDPMPLDTSGIPNDHLGYAVTWFGLAAVWLGMTAFLVWRIARRTG
ncbi:MAG: SURF1 family protein [Gemmobacter sp.]